MRTALIVAGAWLAVGGAVALAGVLSRLGADRRLEDRLTELAARDRLRPRGGHVEAAPIAPPIAAPAPVASNGRRVLNGDAH